MLCMVSTRIQAESVAYRTSPIALGRDERLNTGVNKSHVKSKRALVSDESRLITRLRIGKFICLIEYTPKQIAGFLTELTNELYNDIRRGGMLKIGSVDST